MVLQKLDEQRLKSALVDAIRRDLCHQQELCNSDFDIQGLIGVTVNKHHVFLVHINEKLGFCYSKARLQTCETSEHLQTCTTSEPLETSATSGGLETCTASERLESSMTSEPLETSNNLDACQSNGDILETSANIETRLSEHYDSPERRQSAAYNKHCQFDKASEDMENNLTESNQSLENNMTESSQNLPLTRKRNFSQLSENQSEKSSDTSQDVITPQRGFNISAISEYTATVQGGLEHEPQDLYGGSSMGVAVKTVKTEQIFKNLTSDLSGLQHVHSTSTPDTSGYKALFTELPFSSSLFMSQKRKSTYTKSQISALCSFYKHGMRSAGRELETLHHEAATATGLTLQQVKAWIGNLKAKASRRRSKAEDMCEHQLHASDNIADNSLTELHIPRLSETITEPSTNPPQELSTSHHNAPQELSTSHHNAAGYVENDVLKASDVTMETLPTDEDNNTINSSLPVITPVVEGAMATASEQANTMFGMPITASPEGDRTRKAKTESPDIPTAHCTYHMVRREVITGLNKAFGRTLGKHSVPVQYVKLGKQWQVHGLPVGCELGPSRQPHLFRIAQLRLLRQALKRGQVFFTRIDSQVTKNPFEIKKKKVPTATLR